MERIDILSAAGCERQVKASAWNGHSVNALLDWWAFSQKDKNLKVEISCSKALEFGWCQVDLHDFRGQ